MKYGILTYHNIPNFGAVLQAYALCTAIRSLGAECELIDYQCQNIIKRELIPPRKSNLFRTAANRLFVWPDTVRRIRNCQALTRPMWSEQCYDRDTIVQANSSYDGFISGADLVWDMRINGGDTSYFLDFAKPGKKLFSYASSVDVMWTDAEIETVRPLLSRYDALSVREEQTLELCRTRLHLPGVCSADPTMLLPPAFWETFTRPVSERNYVLVHFLEPNILKAAGKYAAEHNLNLLAVAGRWSRIRERKILVDNPIRLLSLIRSADAVFTNSYHTFLFSLYFNRNVWTNKSGNRIASLLNRLELEQFRISMDPCFQNRRDMSACQEKMSAFRETSLKYLQRMVSSNHE